MNEPSDLPIGTWLLSLIGTGLHASIIESLIILFRYDLTLLIIILILQLFHHSCYRHGDFAAFGLGEMRAEFWNACVDLPVVPVPLPVPATCSANRTVDSAPTKKSSENTVLFPTCALGGRMSYRYDIKCSREAECERERSRESQIANM
jgi:hypothetical protein